MVFLNLFTITLKNHSMCLTPLTIRNPTKKISRTGGQPLLIKVPCGKCADCKKTKRLEWHFRTYYETTDCINKGGYVYFDTLTYDDTNVPRISSLVDISSLGINDFMCFRTTHWRNFLKNLRSYLKYHYKNVNFKYFLTSEYGTDERCSHRPHYHILLFLDNKNIHPFELSSIISKLWTYGRTDGIGYQTRKYVASHVYGYDLGFDSSVSNPVLCVSSYISKYITKDSKFQFEIDKRLNVLEKTLSEEDYKSVKNEVQQFHRQSKGFGIAYINNIDNDEYNYIFNNSACRIIDTDEVVLTISLPLYYKRKLFYKSLKNDENKWIWLPNNQGLSFIAKQLIHNIGKVKNRYFDLVTNASYVEKQLIDQYLHGRTLTDFVIYKILYKGRIRCPESLNTINIQQSNTLSDNEHNLNDWINNIISSQYVQTSKDFEVLNRTEENDVIITTSYGGIFTQPKTKLYDYNSFIRQSTFNENSCPDFRDFDKLDSLFDSIIAPANNQKQITFDFIEDLQQRFKILYNYG